MNFKKITAALLAMLLCLCTMSVSVSAAKSDGIALSKTSASVAVGKSFTLKAKTTEKCVVQWSTSDKSVAAVSKNGTVTGKNIGTAVITAKIKGTDKQASCTVKVVRGKKISAKLTGQDLLDKIKAGVNLANTLDAYNNYGAVIDSELDTETLWGNVKAAEKYFTTVKKAGFNAVRIPVTWQGHMDGDGNISKVWLNRVQEVVNYAYDNGMYVIINVNHEYDWMMDMREYNEETAKKFAKVWKQIAARFRSYDERLIFESMGEPRTPGSENEWGGGTASERAVLNRYHNVFVDTVRASGGNNADRCLIIPTYAAKYTADALNDIKVPNNDKKVIVAIHAYEPWDFTMDITSDVTEFDGRVKSDVDALMNTVNDCLVSRGVPVIIDEFGANHKRNTSDRAEYASYYVSSAKKLGIPCFWWDNGQNLTPEEGEGTGLMDRKTYKWYFPELTEALTGKKVK